jgi:hypothetical protein
MCVCVCVCVRVYIGGGGSRGEAATGVPACGQALVWRRMRLLACMVLLHVLKRRISPSIRVRAPFLFLIKSDLCVCVCACACVRVCVCVYLYIHANTLICIYRCYRMFDVSYLAQRVRERFLLLINCAGSSKGLRSACGHMSPADLSYWISGNIMVFFLYFLFFLSSYFFKVCVWAH